MIEREMPAIVEAWFGSAFQRLHPRIQRLHQYGGTLKGHVDIRYGS